MRMHTLNMSKAFSRLDGKGRFVPIVSKPERQLSTYVIHVITRGCVHQKGEIVSSGCGKKPTVITSSSAKKLRVTPRFVPETTKLYSLPCYF